MQKSNKITDDSSLAGTQIPSLFGLLKKYLVLIITLITFTILANGLSISIPKLISNAIDGYTSDNFNLANLIIKFSVISFFIFLFTYLQNIVQTLVSERVARDMRNNIVAKLSTQPYAYIEEITPTKLLTNLTSDVDSVKMFVSTAVSSIISSAFLIVGVSVLLLTTNWKLALAVLAIMPIIGASFFFVLKKVRKLFKRSQESIDWLNKVISESIFGSALIRLLNSQKYEGQKFFTAATEAKDISFEILKLFSSLIPVINFLTNLATLIIIVLGGYFVVQGEMSLGDFTAFNSYLAILIFPIIILGFISNLIARAQASYERILKVLNAPTQGKNGILQTTLKGNIEIKKIELSFKEKSVLKDISFLITAGSKTAIIGPTSAGKTQLLYLLIGLLKPTAGEIYFDGKELTKYEKKSLHDQVGFVFQDSFLFNLSLRENISFNEKVSDENFEKAIETAELKNFINSLPLKLDTIVSERGSSLSGGQKQRIMLARALALNPKILLLDDFTSRVDANTEKKILANLAKNYPSLTLIAVAQKISSIKNYSQIVLLMEGELLAKGTHEELMHLSPEYVQIFQSQKSTNHYELNNEK